MAHVTEFEIEGLAGRKDVYAKKLNLDVNIFFGLNGSGKTSLLKILHSAMEGNALMLKSVPFTAAEVKIYSKKYDTVVTRTIEKKQLPVQRELPDIEKTPVVEFYKYRNLLYDRFTFGEGIEWKTQGIQKEKKDVSWIHRYLPITRLYLDPQGTVPRYSTDTSPQQTEDMLDTFFAQTMSRLWLSYSNELLSQVRKTQEMAIAGILRKVLAAKRRVSKKSFEDIDMDRAYERVTSFLKRQASADFLGSKEEFADLYREEPGIRSVVDEIDTVEREIEKTMASREKLQVLIREMFTGHKALSFGNQEIQIETDDHTKIRLENLSSGEKHVLKLFIETLLAEGNSIIVDEPELSLHVDWQRQLIANMRLLNPSAQYIFATHSPEIMADVDDAKIFRI